MYTVHVDFVLRFVPPMDDHGHGIRVDRVFELPFPPTSDISVFSKDWEGTEDPMGYHLKEITWDLDKQCFLAETQMSTTGVPVALIPYEIHGLLEQGWTFGSYMDQYRTERRRRRKQRALPILRVSKWDHDEAATWETTRGKSRPKEFLTILHAIIATMAELHNNCGVAYAMSKTQGFVDVPEGLFHRDQSPFQQKFQVAVREYEEWTFDQQWDWCERVQRRYPRMIDVIDSIR